MKIIYFLQDLKINPLYLYIFIYEEYVLFVIST